LGAFIAAPIVALLLLVGVRALTSRNTGWSVRLSAIAERGPHVATFARRDPAPPSVAL